MSLEMFSVHWEIPKTRINNTFGRFIAGVRQVDSWGSFRTVIKIACVYLSQNISVHKNTVRINCEATVFGGDAGWIAQEAIISIFNFQNICIQIIKQSVNKTANYLTRLFVFQPDYMMNWEFVPIETLSY